MNASVVVEFHPSREAETVSGVATAIRFSNTRRRQRLTVKDVIIKPPEKMLLYLVRDNFDMKRSALSRNQPSVPVKQGARSPARKHVRLQGGPFMNGIEETVL